MNQCMDLKNQLHTNQKDLDLNNCFAALKEQEFDTIRALDYVLSGEFKPWVNTQDRHNNKKFTGKKTLDFGSEQKPKKQEKPMKKQQEQKEEQKEVDIIIEEPVEEPVVVEQPVQEQVQEPVEQQPIEQPQPVVEEKIEQEQVQQQPVIVEEVVEQEQPQQVEEEKPKQEQVQQQQPQPQENPLDKFYPPVPNCMTFTEYLNNMNQLYGCYLQTCQKVTQQ